jgi:branched-chain amino acid transport system substrate-binding protein
MKKTCTKWPGLILVGVLLVSSLLTSCQQGKVLKIGYLTEQTGSEAYIAQASTPALEDYIAKINEAGGIGGYKLQLVVYDTRSEVTDAVQVAKRMIRRHSCRRDRRYLQSSSHRHHGL